ncbi:hypothetical protein Tco_0874078 [Tanacetum coccineum]|uniref:Retrotransposon gag domain-containing protein n=1 Tax=Tanacetum coccineum TaxID=301880 RepID=A0ABQ5BNJ2_9ASTR
MSSMSEDIQCAGSDTRPPMLDRTDFESWQQRIRLYCLGKDNGENIMKSINEGPFHMGTVSDVIAAGTEGAVQQGPVRARVLNDLSAEEKERYKADIRATNILLQGIPKDIYSLINHYTDAKDIWDNVKMILEGSELTKDDRESQLYDEFEHFRQIKGETIHGYYVRFTKLINDMRNIKMTMPRMQLNSKFVNNMLPEWSRFITEVKLNRGLKESNFDQLYAYLKQHEVHPNENRTMMERFLQPTNDPLALYVEDNKDHVVQRNVSSVRNDALMLILDEMHEQGVQSRLTNKLDIIINDSMTSELARYKKLVGEYEKRAKFELTDRERKTSPENDLALNVDHIFEADQCDAFDSDIQSTNEEGPSHELANTPFEVQDHDTFVDHMDEYHEVHEMQNDVQHNYVVDSNAEYTSDSNIIPYNQYLEDNEENGVQSNVSSVQNDALMSIINEMHEEEALDFNSFFKIKNLEHQIQEKDNVIRDLKVLVSNVNEELLRVFTLEEMTSYLFMKIESLKAQLKSKVSCVTSDSVKPKVLAPGISTGRRRLRERLIVVIYGRTHRKEILLRRTGNFVILILKLPSESISCFVRDINGADLLKGSRSTNLYTISIDDMMKFLNMVVVQSFKFQIMVVHPLSIENGSLFEGESEFEKLKIYLITLVSIRSDWEDLPWLFRSVENLNTNRQSNNVPASTNRTDGADLLPRFQWLQFGKSNLLFSAFSASASVPAVYIQQFWNSMNDVHKRPESPCNLPGDDFLLVSDKETSKRKPPQKVIKGKPFYQLVDEDDEAQQESVPQGEGDDPTLELAKKMSLDAHQEKREGEGADADIERAIKLSLDPSFLPQGPWNLLEELAIRDLNLSKKKSSTDQFILVRLIKHLMIRQLEPLLNYEDDTLEKVVHESSSTTDSERTKSGTRSRSVHKGDKEQGEVASSHVTSEITLIHRLQLRWQNWRKDMSEVKKTDHSTAVLASIKSQVPTVVDKYLGTKLDDALLRILERHTADLIEKYSVLPGPESIKNQESKKSPKEIIRIKREQGEKKQESTYTIRSTDKVALEEFDLKNALFKHMHKNRTANRNPANYHLYHALMEALIADEDAMDKEVKAGPSAGSNQGKSTKRRRHDSGASGSAQPPPKDSDASASKQHPTLTSTGWQITDTRDVVIDSSMHRSEPKSGHSKHSSDDVSKQDEGHVSDLEDTKVTAATWFKPIPEDERPATPEPEWTIPPNDFPEPENNWANAYATTYQVPAENKLQRKTYDIGSFIKWFCRRTGKKKLCKADLEGPAFNLVKAFHKNSVFLQFQMDECHKLLTNKVDLVNPEGHQILRNIYEPLPLG